MKIRRLLPLFVSASLFTALGMTSVSPVSAQPAPAPAAAKAKKAKGAKRMGALPKKMREKIEAKLGKPLTEDQASRLAVAHRERLDANKASMEKFNQEAAAITGLKMEDLTTLNKRPKAGAVQ